jgi:hypothetical protein
MFRKQGTENVAYNPDYIVAHGFESAMTSIPSPDRRLHSREKFSSVVYVDFDAGNGGIILNISEGGLAVQAARALIEDELPSLRFRFSRSDNWISGKGVVAWKTKSKKMAGLRFVDLSEEARTQISNWISSGGSRNKVEQPNDTSAPTQSLPSASLSDNGKRQMEKPEEGTPVGKALSANSMPSAQTTSTMLGVEQVRIVDAPAPPAGSAGSENSAQSTEAAPNQAVAEPRRPDSPQFRRSIGPRSLLKRFLVDERHRIRLHDLVSEETEKLYRELTEANFPTNEPVTDEGFVRRVHRYEELSDELVAMITIGCFWGEQQHAPVWTKLLERIANATGTRQASNPWVCLQLYPALLLFYAAGIAAIANEKYATLEPLFLKPRLIGLDGDCRLLEELNAPAVIKDEKLGRLLANGRVPHAPLSAYLHAYLRERFREFVPSDFMYDEIFDRFEYLLALIWIDESPVAAILDRVPLGLFAWEESSMLEGVSNIEGKVASEVKQQNKDWPAFRAGLFGGSTQRFTSARNRVATYISLRQEAGSLGTGTLPTSR